MAALARRRLGHVAPPERNPSPERKTMSRTPIVLTGNPAWGKRDSVLARMVFRNLVDTTPAIVIPANPLADTKLRKELRHFGVAFHHE
jgi:hypothetical protein